MTKSPGTTAAIGAVMTLAAFISGHFIYEAGSQKLGFLIGVMAMAPLALASLQAWRSSGKTWAKLLFWIVILLWAAMLLFSVM